MTLHLALTVEGPFLTSGLDQAGFRIDATRARDATGRPTLPWSHLRGHLREALVELLATHKPNLSVAQAERAVSCLFGAPDEKMSRGAPSAVMPRSLRVGGDLATQPREADLGWQVAMDAFRGTARDRHLTVRECGHPDDTWTCDAELDLLPVSGLSDDDVLQLVTAAATWMRGFGKGANQGWGRITSRAVTRDKASISLAPDLPARLDRLLSATPTARASLHATAPLAAPYPDAAEVALRIRLQGPLVIGDGLRGTNVFTARGDIPGSALRRALAELLLAAAGQPPGGWVDGQLTFNHRAYDLEPADLQAIASAFPHIHASFGAPVDPSTEAPTPVLPFTTFAGHDQYQQLIKGDLSGVDPKQAQLDASATPAFVRTALHAHVAKDRETGAARHGMLFTYRAVEESWDGRPACFDTTLRVPKALAASITKLAAHIPRLGKAIGRGYGRVSTEPGPTPTHTLHLSPTRTSCRLIVQTEALLLARADVTTSGDLAAPYSRALTAALGAPVTVTHVFAHHRLRGGFNAGGPGAIPPAILSQPGTTLRLAWRPADAPAVLKALETASRWGLQRADELSDLERHWARVCPYRIENGYGRIQLDTPGEVL